MRPETWQLFVDESGDFSAGGPVVVGGWLLRSPDSPALRAWLAKEIDQALPSAPRPQHARDCNLLSTRVVARRTHTDPLLQKALQRLESGRGHPHVEPVLTALQANRLPAYAELESCGAWLTRVDRPLAEALKQMRDLEHRRLFSVLAQIPAADSATVLAFEERSSALAPGADRYLDLLQALFERVLGLFRAEDARVTIRAHVLTRHVTVPFLPRVPLRAVDIGNAVRRAERFPLFPVAEGHADERVRIVAEVPAEWGPTTHPGLVMADWICNRSLHLLGSLGSSTGWDAVRERFQRRVQRDPMAKLRARPDRDVPTVAVRGVPRDAIAVAFGAGRGAVTPAECPVRWQAEQANLWIEAAR